MGNCDDAISHLFNAPIPSVTTIAASALFQFYRTINALTHKDINKYN